MKYTEFTVRRNYFRATAEVTENKFKGRIKEASPSGGLGDTVYETTDEKEWMGMVAYYMEELGECEGMQNNFVFDILIPMITAVEEAKVQTELDNVLAKAAV